MRNQVIHTTIGSTGLSGAAGRDPAVVNAVHRAFTDASHTGWLVAAGCGG
ncbi:MAG: hypothetical protein M3Y91_00010 [Actinomycetota bacterium]|nr:hypothetical protein [Actinomycetota bacterium]